jgi:hypothetical protein
MWRGKEQNSNTHAAQYEELQDIKQEETGNKTIAVMVLYGYEMWIVTKRDENESVN